MSSEDERAALRRAYEARKSGAPVDRRTVDDTPRLWDREEFQPDDFEHTTYADPLAGTIPGAERAQRSDGRNVGPGRTWNWDPRGQGPPVHVRGDGAHTAHGGVGGETRREDPLEGEMRRAGLTPDEMAVTRLRVADDHGRVKEYVDIAAELKLSFWQVQRLVKSSNAKLRAAHEATQALRRAED